MPCVTPTGLVVFVETDSCPGTEAVGSREVSLRRPLHSYRADHAARGRPLPLARRPCRTAASSSPGGPATAPDRSACIGSIRRRAGASWSSTTRTSTRSRPGIVSPRPRPDGRSSVVSTGRPAGRVLLHERLPDRFKNRSWLPPGSVKTLRVIEGMPATGRRRRGIARAISVPELSARRILAEVPVKADGSFHLTVPASTPIQLQILDDRGLALRSCGWIWARNHQAQGCIGCHEDPELTPPNRVPDALKRAVRRRRLSPSSAGSRSISPPTSRRSSRRSAHPATARASRRRTFDQSPARRRRRHGRRLYEALLGRARTAAATRDRASMFIPGGRGTSPLVWHLLGTEHGPALGRSRQRGARPSRSPPGRAPPSPRPRSRPSSVDRSGSTIGRAAGRTSGGRIRVKPMRRGSAVVSASGCSRSARLGAGPLGRRRRAAGARLHRRDREGRHPLQAQLRRQGAEQHRRGDRRRCHVLRLRRRRLARHLPRHRPVSPRRQRQHGPPAQGQALQPPLPQQPRRHLHRRDRQGGRRRRRGLRRGLLGRRLRRRRPRRSLRPQLRAERPLPQQRRRHLHRRVEEVGPGRSGAGASRASGSTTMATASSTSSWPTTSSTTAASSATSTPPPVIPARSAIPASPTTSTATTATARSPT